MVKIGRFIPKPVKKRIIDVNQKNYYRQINKRYDTILEELRKTAGEKRIILIGTSVFGNIGDQAISIAEMTFLMDTFPNQIIIEIPLSLYKMNDFSSLINKGDLLFINGGGYMGSLWIEAQEIIDKVVENHLENKIIIFPQTIHYDSYEDDLLKKHQTIYNKHKNVTVFVRDQKSYDLAIEFFNFKEVCLVPDIVTYLEKNDYHIKKENITFIMRDDFESVSNKSQLEDFENLFKESGRTDIRRRDNIVAGVTDFLNRDDILENYYKEIGNCEFVVSDRLHGLLLPIIAGIPVIILDNVSNKTFGVYTWFKNYDYVIYSKDIDLEDKVRMILNGRETYRYDKSVFKDYHDRMKVIIKKEFFS